MFYLALENRNIGDIFACGDRSKGATAKWTLVLDSERQIEVFTILNGKLMVVGNMLWVGFENSKSESFLRAGKEPTVVQSNGCCRWIQRIN